MPAAIWPPSNGSYLPIQCTRHKACMSPQGRHSHMKRWWWHDINVLAMCGEWILWGVMHWRLEFALMMMEMYKFDDICGIMGRMSNLMELRGQTDTAAEGCIRKKDFIRFLFISWPFIRFYSLPLYLSTYIAQVLSWRNSHFFCARQFFPIILFVCKYEYSTSFLES